MVAKAEPLDSAFRRVTLKVSQQAYSSVHLEGKLALEKKVIDVDFDVPELMIPKNFFG